MGWPKYTAKERVLLHLFMNQFSTQSLEVSERITQVGIARGIDVERKNIPRAVSALEDNGLLVSQKKYVPPYNIKHMAYFLTDEGRRTARLLMNDIESQRYVLAPGEEVGISKLLERYPGIPLPALFKYVDRENVVDLEALELKVKSERYVRLMDEYAHDEGYVGRKAESNTIMEWLESESDFLVVTGMAGIGKSTLVKETLLAVENRSIVWFNIRKWNTLHDLTDRCKTFLTRVGIGDFSNGTPETEGARRVMEEFRRYVENNDTLLVFDNLHNASGGIIDHVVELLEGDLPVKAILIGRSMPDGVAHTLLDSDLDVRSIALEGLSEKETLEFLEKNGIDRRNADIISKARGHPLLLRHSSGGHWERVGRMEVILGRAILQNISPGEEAVLLRIAVCRNPVPASLVREGPEGTETVRKLELAGSVLEREGVLSMDELIKDAVLATASTDRLREVHSWMGGRFKELPTSEGRLEAVYHFFAARDYRNAYDCALDCAGYLCKRGLGQPLLSIIEKVEYQLLPKVYHLDHVFLLARLLEETGSWDDAVFNYSRLLEEVSGDERNRVLKRLAYVELKRGRYEKSKEYVREAIESDTVSRNDLVEFLYLSATLDEYLGMLERSLSAYSQMVELTKETGSKEYRAKAFYGLGKIHIKLKDTNTAIGMMERARDIYTNMGLLEEEQKVLLGMAAAHYTNGNLEKAIGLQTEAYDMAFRLNNPRLQAYAQLNSVDPLLELKKFDDALKACNSATLLFRMIGDRAMIFSSVVKMIRINYHMKDWEEFESNISLASRYLDSTPINQARCHFHMMSSVLAERQGDAPRAIRELKRSEKVAHQLGTFVFDGYLQEKLNRLEKRMEERKGRKKRVGGKPPVGDEAHSSVS